MKSAIDEGLGGDDSDNSDIDETESDDDAGNGTYTGSKDEGFKEDGVDD